MKKLSKSIMLVMMAVVFALSIVGCDKKPAKEPSNESEAESVYVPTPEPIVGAGENGYYNLGNALEVLDPILDNNYITFSINMSIATDVAGEGESLDLSATVNLKKTVRGFDVIANIEGESVDAYGESNYKIDLYYVDGKALIGYPSVDDETDEMVMFYQKLPEVPSFNGFINQLNVMIATDPEYAATYDEVMPIVEEIGEVVKTLETADLNYSGAVQLADVANTVVAYILDAKDVSLYDCILMALGVDPTDAEAVASFEEGLMAQFAANPTLGELVNGAVDSINDAMLEQARLEAEAAGVEFDPTSVMTIDLETLLGMLESELGMTALQMYNALSEKMDLSQIPAPKATDSLFAYLDRMLSPITVNDLAVMIAGEEGVVFTDILAMYVAYAKECTFGDFVNELVNSIAGGSVEYDEEGNPIVTNTDFVAMLEAIQVEFETLDVTYVLKTDSYGRLTEFGESITLGAELNMQVSETDFERVDVSVVESVSIKIDYKQPSVKFAIPADLWEKAEDLTAEQA